MQGHVGKNQGQFGKRKKRKDGVWLPSPWRCFDLLSVFYWIEYWKKDEMGYWMLGHKGYSFCLVLSLFFLFSFFSLSSLILWKPDSRLQRLSSSLFELNWGFPPTININYSAMWVNHLRSRPFFSNPDSADCSLGWYFDYNL